jgi:hypothetical protein
MEMAAIGEKTANYAAFSARQAAKINTPPLPLHLPSSAK